MFNAPRPSLGEIVSEYAISFRFLGKPGLELASAMQLTALLIGFALSPLWWHWIRRTDTDAARHHDLPPNVR